jgi:ribosomal-protein-serine acetyltransferase
MSEDKPIFETKKLAKEIEGDRIVLKMLEPTFKNAETMFKMVDENREHLGKWLGWVEKTKGPEDSFNALKNFDDKCKKNINATYRIFIGDECIGGIDCFGENMPNGIGELGYMLAEKHCGKGYMTEAIEIFEVELFRNGMQRIQIRFDPENIGSAKVAQNTGYSFEGINRCDQYIKKTNEYRDTGVASKLKSDWLEEAE